MAKKKKAVRKGGRHPMAVKIGALKGELPSAVCDAAWRGLFPEHIDEIACMIAALKTFEVRIENEVATEGERETRRAAAGIAKTPVASSRPQTGALPALAGTGSLDRAQEIAANAAKKALRFLTDATPEDLHKLAKLLAGRPFQFHSPEGGNYFMPRPADHTTLCAAVVCFQAERMGDEIWRLLTTENVRETMDRLRTSGFFAGVDEDQVKRRIREMFGVNGKRGRPRNG